MRPTLRWTIVAAALVGFLVACGSDDPSRSPTTEESPESPGASAPASTEPAPTSTQTVVSTQFVQPVDINNSNEVLLSAVSIAAGAPGGSMPPDAPLGGTSSTAVLDLDSGDVRIVPDGGTEVSVVGLNDAGLVAGTRQTGFVECGDIGDRCARVDAFVWDSVADRLTTLPEWKAVDGPNAAGQVVVSQDPDGAMTLQNQERLAVWDTATGSVTGLAGPDSDVASTGWMDPKLNDRGQVLGSLGIVEPPGVAVVVWDTATGAIDWLASPPGGWRVPSPVGIDEAGRAVVDDQGTGGSYVWEPSRRDWRLLEGSVPLVPGVPLGSARGTATAISGSGLVAGHAWSGASGDEPPSYEVLMWDLEAGSLRRVSLGDSDYASITAVNDDGWMIANLDTETRTEPYSYDPTRDDWAPITFD